jgi:hypothetical protein
MDAPSDRGSVLPQFIKARNWKKKSIPKKKKSTFELTTTVAGARKIAMRIEQAKYTLQLQLSRGLNNCLDSDYVAFFQTT